MEQNRKKQWLLGILLSSLFLLFFFGWLTIDQAIDAVVSGSWTFPIIWFSLGISLLCLTPFVLNHKRFLWVAAITAFLPSLLFAQASIFLAAILLGTAVSVIGLLRMRHLLMVSLSIRIRRSVQYGMVWMVLSFALVITSFYYVQIRQKSGEELLQKLSIDQTSHVILTRALGWMNPEFKKADQQKVTVDEFLLTLQKQQSVSDTITSPPSDEELLQMVGMQASDPRAPQTLVQLKKELAKNATTLNTQSLVLEQGRRQLSGIVGRPVLGQESIADVLSQVIDQRVRTYFKPDTASESSSILPFVLSLILFVTLWSLGSLLGIVWRFVTAALFVILRRFGAVEVKKVMVEQEVIG